MYIYIYTYTCTCIIQIADAHRCLKRSDLLRPSNVHLQLWVSETFGCNVHCNVHKAIMNITVVTVMVVTMMVLIMKLVTHGNDHDHDNACVKTFQCALQWGNMPSISHVSVR